MSIAKCSHSEERPVIGCCDPWGVDSEMTRAIRTARATGQAPLHRPDGSVRAWVVIPQEPLEDDS